MGIISWMVNTAERFMPRPTASFIGLARKVLRSIVSWASKTEQSLPNIIETMEKIDPGKTYGEWATQYRAQMQSLSQEKRLALWDRNTLFDDSVIVNELLRRAKKFRYIFSVKIVDMETGNDGWKMFSMYADELMTPQQVIDKYMESTFGSKYGNAISYEDYSFYRVQRWSKE